MYTDRLYTELVVVSSFGGLATVVARYYLNTRMQPTHPSHFIYVVTVRAQGAASETQFHAVYDSL